MGNKGLAVFGLVALVLLSLSVVVADISVSDISELDRASGSFDVTISSTENETITINTIDPIVENSRKITFTINETNFDILDNETHVVSISYVVDSNFEFEFNKVYSTVLNVSGNESASLLKTISFDVNDDFCEEGCDNVGELEIKKFKVKLLEGYGDAGDDYFYPLDDIEVSFEVKNDGKWDVDNIEILICLYDIDSDDCIFDEDDFDIDEDDFDLKDGKDIDVVATLEIDPNDLTAGNTKYKIFVSASGEIDDKNGVHDGDITSVSDSAGFDILTDSDFVIVEGIEFNPNLVFCGSDVLMSARVWNVGDNDLDNDDVYMRVFSNALGLDEKIEFIRGIDSMDYKEIVLNVEIPVDLDEKRAHQIEFTVYDDERMTNRYIFESSEDDDAEYSFFFNIDDCGVKKVSEPLLSANLLSDEVMVGEDVVVSVTVTNPSDKKDNFVVSINGYDSWAELVSVEPTVLNLDAGESADVLVTFNSQEAGVHNFNVRVVSSDNDVVQDVSLSVSGDESTFFDFKNIGGGNLTYWIAGVLVVLILFLFVLILVVSVRRRSV